VLEDRVHLVSEELRGSRHVALDAPELGRVGRLAGRAGKGGEMQATAVEILCRGDLPMFKDSGAICDYFTDPRRSRLRTLLSNLIRDESGVTAIEYALIAALIAVAAIAAFTLVGTNLSTTFSTIAAKL
jgi:pilus assembly protein Flp/PilA